MPNSQEDDKENVRQAELQAARDAEQLTRDEDEKARLNAAKTLEKFTSKQADDE